MTLPVLHNTVISINQTLHLGKSLCQVGLERKQACDNWVPPCTQLSLVILPFTLLSVALEQTDPTTGSPQKKIHMEG